MDKKIDDRVGGKVHYYQSVAFIFDKVRLKSEAPPSSNDNVTLISLTSVVERIQGFTHLDISYNCEYLNGITILIHFDKLFDIVTNVSLLIPCIYTGPILTCSHYIHLRFDFEIK
jgi:hypothetical protein